MIDQEVFIRSALGFKTRGFLIAII